MSWRRAILWFLVAALFVCFFRLGSTGAIRNEGIVADGARHMVRTGDLLVPHLYNEPYTYKPPLTNWLVTLAFAITGQENTWTLRLPIALCGLLMGLTVLVGVGRISDPRTGLVCAFATLTSGLSLEKLRIAEYDLPLAAGVGLAVMAASSNLVVARPRMWTWLLCYAGLAFGVLAKGSPALMAFFPGLVVASWLVGRQGELLSSRHLVGFAIFLLVVATYVWLSVVAGHPGVFDQPIAEARARGLQWDSKALGLTLVKPLAVVVAFLPWSVLLPPAVLGLRRTVGAGPALGLLRCGLGFTGGALLAFLAVPSFEVRYFYPLAVPVGVVCGLVAADGVVLPAAFRVAVRRAALGLSWLLAGIALVAGMWLARGVDRMLVTLLAVLALTMLFAGRRNRMSTARVVALGVLCLWAVHLFIQFPRVVEKRSFERSAEALVPRIPGGSWLWIGGTVGDRESLLTFYLDRPTIRLREGRSAPLPGSLGVMTSETLDGSDPGPGLRWVEIGRAANSSIEYILSRLVLDGCAAQPDLYERRVEDLYSALMDRPPTSTELRDATARLRSGTPLVEFARELLAAAESPAVRRGPPEEVARHAFHKILGRTPALETYPAIRLGRRSLPAAVVGLMASKEYVARNPYCQS